MAAKRVRQLFGDGGLDEYSLSISHVNCALPGIVVKTNAQGGPENEKSAHNSYRFDGFRSVFRPVSLLI
jgi:hypothetical protein